ncbi:hypothetical protein [Flaviaesturariibacter terrae]
MKLLLLGTTMMLLSALAGNAQTTPPAPAAAALPCLNGPHRGDFDFWIGEWDVYATGTTVLVGHSHVSKAEGGCAVLEQWKAANGTNFGNSINFFDAVAGCWVQVYAGSGGGNTTYAQGVYRDSAMRFTFTSTIPGRKGSGHLTFYNVGPDEVRQLQDFTAEGAATAQVNYDFTYKRRK